ncbi:MAG: AbrB/MazE/SpoVT family DNA-binding domain-containing protein [Nitrososphaerota archaeon]|nr:AbrB/MazE/SpoVT family DNA-binding domain-containing protein [Nitrososphaerota archaeon]
MPVNLRVLLWNIIISLGARLPRPIVEGFQWKEGDEIVLYVSEGQITLEKGRGAGELKKGAKAKGQKP